MGLNWLNWLQLVQSVITLRGMQLITINAIIRQTTPTRDIEMASSSVALSHPKRFCSKSRTNDTVTVSIITWYSLMPYR